MNWYFSYFNKLNRTCKSDTRSKLIRSVAQFRENITEFDLFTDSLQTFSHSTKHHRCSQVYTGNRRHETRLLKDRYHNEKNIDTQRPRVVHRALADCDVLSNWSKSGTHNSLCRTCPRTLNSPASVGESSDVCKLTSSCKMEIRQFGVN